MTRFNPKAVKEDFGVKFGDVLLSMKLKQQFHAIRWLYKDYHVELSEQNAQLFISDLIYNMLHSKKIQRNQTWNILIRYNEDAQKQIISKQSKQKKSRKQSTDEEEKLSVEIEMATNNDDQNLNNNHNKKDDENENSTKRFLLNTTDDYYCVPQYLIESLLFQLIKAFVCYGSIDLTHLRSDVNNILLAKSSSMISIHSLHGDMDSEEFGSFGIAGGAGASRSIGGRSDTSNSNSNGRKKIKGNKRMSFKSGKNAVMQAVNVGRKNETDHSQHIVACLNELFEHVLYGDIIKCNVLNDNINIWDAASRRGNDGSTIVEQIDEVSELFESKHKFQLLLHFACQFSYKSVIKFLVDSGSQIKWMDRVEC